MINYSLLNQNFIPIKNWQKLSAALLCLPFLTETKNQKIQQFKLIKTLNDNETKKPKSQACQKVAMS